MRNVRNTLVESNILQNSPTKLTLDLHEARKKHRSRNRSSEHIQFSRFKKERICQDIQDLESSWTELQQIRKKQSTINSERSLSKHFKTVGMDEMSPERPKGIQLISRMPVIDTCTPQRGPHRTQIFLTANKINKVNTSNSVLQQKKQTETKICKPVRNSRKNTPTQTQKPLHYLEQVFSSCVQKVLNVTPKNKQKIFQASSYFSSQKHQISCSDICNSNMNRKESSQGRSQTRQTNPSQMKKLKITKISSNRDYTSQNSIGKVSAKLFDCSKMEIQSILFKRTASRLY